MTAVELDPDWTVGGRPHGGYLLATMVGVALDTAHPHPLAVSAHFLSSPDPGAAQVQVERVRTGRRVATSRLRLLAGGVVCVEALLTSGRHAAPAGTRWSAGGPPQLVDVADCPRSMPDRPGGPRVAFLDRVEMRMDTGSVGYAGGPPTGRGENRGWLRRADGADPGMLDLLVFADALPPVTLDLGLPGWVPTVELTVLVRGVPAPGWCTAVQRSRQLGDGWLDEDCEVWDGGGRLVVQARQLAGYRETAAGGR